MRLIMAFASFVGFAMFFVLFFGIQERDFAIALLIFSVWLDLKLELIKIDKM